MEISNIKTNEDGSMNLSINVKLDENGSFLQTEESIMDNVNELGKFLTGNALKHLDETDEEIEKQNIKFKLNNVKKKNFKTPYGTVVVEANIYEDIKTKKRYSEIENKIGIIKGVTPKLAKSVTSKALNMAINKVEKDFNENHNIKISETLISNTVYRVETINKKNDINYEMSEEIIENKDIITTVAIGMDGTCVPAGTQGYREAMVGTISFYDKEGERLDTIYVAEAPEYGKLTFKNNLTKEIERMKEFLPKTVTFVGLADGAAENWIFLTPYIDIEILDFYHVTEYLAKISPYMNPDNPEKWLTKSCDKLKNKSNGARKLLKDMKKINKEMLSEEHKKILESTITYFENHKHQMKYSKAIKANIPIGSGVTESACKTIIKERACISGARWSISGLKSILNLKAINSTTGRWQQFWNFIAS